MDKLSARQLRFCREFILDNNASAAYVRAGYSKNGCGPSAHKLLKNPKVKAKVLELQTELPAENGITLKTIVNDLLYDRERAREQKNINAAIKASVEIAKLMGYFKRDNRQKATTLEKMTTSELIELAKQLAEDIEKEQASTQH
jgi:phage terminase small subunit